MERVHSAGAHFDYDKAKWYNHEWIKQLSIADFRLQIEKGFLPENHDESKLDKIIPLVKDRCTLLTDFTEQSSFFFKAPETLDTDSVKPKWNDAKQLFFVELIRNYELTLQWDATTLESNFKEIASVNGLKPGELMLPFRIMLVGGKFGPGVFDIADVLGKEETISRIKKALDIFSAK